MRVTGSQPRPGGATIYLLPQLWFRNTWSWKRMPQTGTVQNGTNRGAISVKHASLGGRRINATSCVFCENRDECRRIFGLAGAQGHFKDAFDEYVHGNRTAVNPEQTGTKAGACLLTVPAGGSEPQIRFTSGENQLARKPFATFDARCSCSVSEGGCLLFTATLQAASTDADARNVQRRAFAGMIWSKQFFYYDVAEWIKGDPGRRRPANVVMVGTPTGSISTTPTSFRCRTSGSIRGMPRGTFGVSLHPARARGCREFAKQQLVCSRADGTCTQRSVAAYEWAFGDVNPPSARGPRRVFQMDRKQRREIDAKDKGDLAFLERVFHKLMLNFTVGESQGRARSEHFPGGFLGLDNIGVFDRSAPLPTGGFINQADGTSWMAMYSPEPHAHRARTRAPQQGL